ncbi:MAG: Uncharacterized protein CEO21_352 [Microgenomates group bacterium Gr01-1014_80]|nr:MAG: Uncharacterized protein CEO21_352 [Microgenomates group bacterium Gr01-1014_80]
MKFSVAKVVGLNSDLQAAQVISYLDDPGNIFLALLDLTSDDAFTTGRQSLSDLVDFYLEQQTAPGEHLKSTFGKAKEILKEAPEYSILLAAISGRVLYIISQGEVKCFLRRVDKISALEVPDGQLISGFLQEGDRVFLATADLANSLGDDLKSTLELPSGQWEEEMGARVTIGSLKDEGQEDEPLAPRGRAGLILDVEADFQEEPIRSAGGIEAVKAARSSELKKKLIALVSNIRVPGAPGIFPSSGRLRLVLALVLISILALGAGLKYKNSSDKERQSQFNQFLQAAKDDYSAAAGLQTLNPADATLKIASAKENLEKALKLMPKNSQALDLKKQIEENVGSMGQKFENIQFSEYLDLDLVKKGFRATTLSLSAGKLLLLNPDDSTLVVIDVAKKSQKILAGKEKLGEGKLASVNGDSSFSFSKDKGIIRVDAGSSQASASAKPDKDWGEIADITGFGGNIYLLDKGAPSKSSGQIWKYLAVSGGYSGKRKYLAEGVKADFNNALRMQIESSVYVLKSGGEILRFTRGEADNFSIGGLDKGIKDPKSMFVSSDTDNLYVLDSGNSRLVVLTKTGGYVSQYSGDKFGSATDLVVDEKGKKVYLPEGSKIWQTDLK